MAKLVDKYQTPSPVHTTVGQPDIPVSALNSPRYRLARYGSGKLMVERKGIGYRVSEEMFDAWLHERFTQPHE